MEALFVVGAVAFAGVFVFAVWYLSPSQVAKRAMLSVPLRAIPDVGDGEKVRVVGTVDLMKSIRAPLSGRACAYWSVIVKERRGTGKHRYWVTLVDEHEGVDFLVREGEEKALVKTALVRPLLDKDASYSSGFLNDASPELMEFLADRGLSSEGWVFNKNMNYREGVVEPGETVAVVGIGHWEHDPDGQTSAGSGYRDANAPTRLVISAPDDGPLLLSDQSSTTG